MIVVFIQYLSTNRIEKIKMYDEGHGVAQDCKQAIQWYRRAAEQGNASA
jgi:TPR repeat protein